MGLDMYLSRKNKEGQMEEAGYWRKANAIHNYFVTNIQNGNDDQRSYRVPKRVFKDLLAKCTAILDLATAEGFRTEPDENGNCREGFKASEKLTDLCNEQLPTQSGFFFGSTDYDDWYFHQIAYTKKLIEGIFEAWDTDGHKSYYYSCWW